MDSVDTNTDRDQETASQSGVQYFHDVFEAELEQLIVRRESAELAVGPITPQCSAPHGHVKPNSESLQDRDPLVKPNGDSATSTAFGQISQRDKQRMKRYLKNELIGLALSGGGLRAATFSLGVLQSMRAHGLLRYFDYISSVSGGGYTAGYLATQATLQAEHDERARADSATNGSRSRRRTSYHDLDQSSPSSSVGHDSIEVDRFDKRGWLSNHDFFVFRDCGRYLARPWEFAGNHVLQSIPILLMFFCGIVMCATLAALLYRSFDLPIAQDVVQLASRRGGDVLRAFLPTIGLAFCWAIVKLANELALWGIRTTSVSGSQKTLFQNPRFVFLTTLLVCSGAWLLIVNLRTFNGLPDSLIGSLVTLLAPCIAIVASLAMAIVLFRRRWPCFYGLRQLPGWNGGSMALIPVILGLLVLVDFVMADQLSNGWLFQKMGDSVLIRQENLLIAIAFGAIVWLAACWAYLGVTKVSDLLFRLTLLSLPAALIICITNGILGLGFLEDLMETSGLPVVKQESLQQPLMIYVLVATLALTQYRRLLRSQRPGASLGERLALHFVITGVVLGIPLLIFGSIAQENYSGFATKRDPELLEGDIVFENLAEWWHDPNARGGSGQGIFNVDLASNVPSLNGQAFPLQTYLERHNKFRETFFGFPGWDEESQGWGSPKGVIGRWAIASGLSKAHRRELNDYFGNECNWGAATLRNCREKITESLNKALNDQQMTQRLSEVLRARVDAGANKIDLPKVREYLFETALDEMQAIYSKHSTAEQRDLLTYYDHATEHLSPDDQDEGTLFFGANEHDEYWRYPVDPNDDSASQGESRLAHFNRLLLERLYPDIFLRSTRVSTQIVPIHDQTERCYLLIASSLVFGILYLFVPMNALSPMHFYYRDKIRNEFLQKYPLESLSHAKNGSYAMHDLKKAIQFGAPIHLFVANVRLGVPLRPDAQTASANPSEDSGLRRFHHSYVYSPLHIGSPAIGYQTAGRGDGQQDVGLDDAVTVSGAAVNPTAMANGALRWILTAFNLRLGEWIFNPSLESKYDWLRRRIGPTPRHVLAEWARPMVNEGIDRQEGVACSARARDVPWWERWTVGSVSDGGFVDFLGIDELLRRRCRIVVVVDSSINSNDLELNELGEAVRKARLDHGCEILDIDDDKPLDIERLRRNEDGLAAQHMILGRILYPDCRKDELENTESSRNQEGLLVYVQMTRSGDEDVDVAQFAHAVKSFPDHPTPDQFFDEGMVEAYRRLGRHVGDAICAGLPNHAVLERARNEYGEHDVNQKDGQRFFLNVEELTDALIESYRLDCREVRIDRRDDLRRMPINTNSTIFNSCYRLPERLYSPEIRTLFDLQQEPPDQVVPANQSEFYAKRLNEERFLRLYETDPNLRYRVRRFVGSIVHERWDLFETIKRHQERFGQLSAYVAACHDFCLVQDSPGAWSDSHISVSGDAFRVTDGRDLLVGEDRFQAGGRYELLAACITINSSIVASESLEEDDLRAFRRSVIAIADSVFRYRGAETAYMLLTFFENNATQNSWSDEFVNEIRELKDIVKRLARWHSFEDEEGPDDAVVIGRDGRPPADGGHARPQPVRPR